MTGTHASSAGSDHQGYISTHYIATEPLRHRRLTRGIHTSLGALLASFLFLLAACCFYGNRHITIDQGCAYLIICSAPMAISTVLAYMFFALRSEWRYYRYNKVIGTLATFALIATLCWFIIWPVIYILHYK